MTVDIETAIEIDRPREVVATFASDPDNVACSVRTTRRPWPC